jgi:hypothetical protein
METCTCIICDPPGKVDDFLMSTVRNVESHGRSVVGVAEGEDEPAWAYSIGLWHSSRLPEIAMFGLEVDDMWQWLNEVADHAKRGLTLSEGGRIAGVLDGHDLHIRPVHHSWRAGLFGGVSAFYQHATPPMIELIWPDRNGKLPWEEGARARCREWQPRLWMPLAEHHVGPWAEIASA